MASLLLIPLDDTVVFPTMDVTLPIDVGTDEQVVLVPRHDGEYASVGTIANVTDRVRLPGGGRGASLEGVSRGVIGAAQTDLHGQLRVEVTPHPDETPVDGRTRELEREYRATVEELLELPERAETSNNLAPRAGRAAGDRSPAISAIMGPPEPGGDNGYPPPSSPATLYVVTAHDCGAGTRRRPRRPQMAISPSVVRGS